METMATDKDDLSMKDMDCESDSATTNENEDLESGGINDEKSTTGDHATGEQKVFIIKDLDSLIDKFQEEKKEHKLNPVKEKRKGRRHRFQFRKKKVRLEALEATKAALLESRAVLTARGETADHLDEEVVEIVNEIHSIESEMRNEKFANYEDECESKKQGTSRETEAFCAGQSDNANVVASLTLKTDEGVEISGPAAQIIAGLQAKLAVLEKKVESVENKGDKNLTSVAGYPDSTTSSANFAFNQTLNWNTLDPRLNYQNVNESMLWPASGIPYWSELNRQLPPSDPYWNMRHKHWQNFEQAQADRGSFKIPPPLDDPYWDDLKKILPPSDPYWHAWRNFFRAYGVDSKETQKPKSESHSSFPPPLSDPYWDELKREIPAGDPYWKAWKKYFVWQQRMSEQMDTHHKKKEKGKSSKHSNGKGKSTKKARGNGKNLLGYGAHSHVPQQPFYVPQQPFHCPQQPFYIQQQALPGPLHHRFGVMYNGPNFGSSGLGFNPEMVGHHPDQTDQFRPGQPGWVDPRDEPDTFDDSAELAPPSGESNYSQISVGIEEDQTDLSLWGEKICPLYQKNKCPLGRKKCPMRHVKMPEKKNMVCKAYLKSVCVVGERCPYLHETFPCKLFHAGLTCTQGATCKFSHDPLTDVGKQALKSFLKEEAESKGKQKQEAVQNVIGKMVKKIKDEQQWQKSFEEGFDRAKTCEAISEYDELLASISPDEESNSDTIDLTKSPAKTELGRTASLKQPDQQTQDHTSCSSADKNHPDHTPSSSASQEKEETNTSPTGIYSLLPQSLHEVAQLSEKPSKIILPSKRKPVAPQPVIPPPKQLKKPKVVPMGPSFSLSGILANLQNDNDSADVQNDNDWWL